MKTAGLILYTLMGIWAFYSFETTKITLTSKYLFANFISNPIKTSSYTLIIILIVFGFGIIINKGFINPIRNQISIIEPIFTAYEERNYDTKKFKRSEFIKIYEKLNKSTNKNLSDKQQVLRFLENSKSIYQNIPPIIQSGTTYNTKIFNMNRVTQVTMLRIENYKHTIIFISHNPSKADQSITVYDYQNLPDNNSLHQILDPIFTNEILNTLRNDFEMWLNGGSIHGSAGLSVTTSKNLDGEWLYIGVPKPFNDYNLNNLIAENLGFQNRI
jgi:hypothetical protein